MIRKRTKNQLGSPPMRTPNTRASWMDPPPNTVRLMLADCSLPFAKRLARPSAHERFHTDWKEEELGAQRDLHPRRRNRPRDRRGHPARAGGHRRRVRVGLSGRG